MTLKLTPITLERAIQILESKTEITFTNNRNDFAIAAKDDENIHGVILMRADGKECALVHLYTDGTALVGSLLYGAAWRTAKALGYTAITI